MIASYSIASWPHFDQDAGSENSGKKNRYNFLI